MSRVTPLVPEPAPRAEALDPRLRVVSEEPLNAETSLAEPLALVTPNALFYVRSHGVAPRLAAAQWRLAVQGEVQRPLTLSYEQLRALPARTLKVTLECAGNGRSYLRPVPPGEPWQRGAVSTAEWTGVPLRAVLEVAGLAPKAVEVLFVGADVRDVADAGKSIPFARSLPVRKALDPDTLLAYEMNGAPLPLDHGFPLRLVVPGWYGMASVKWLTRIEAVAEPFEGFYQKDRYVLSRTAPGASRPTPLTTMLPRSLIVAPADGAVVPLGPQRILGVAWSGEGEVARVEVSADGGARWEAAAFTSPPERHAWRRWEHRWDACEPGAFTLLSRAFDSAGRAQPLEPAWNWFGYANNAVQSVRVAVR